MFRESLAVYFQNNIKLTLKGTRSKQVMPTIEHYRKWFTLLPLPYKMLLVTLFLSIKQLTP
jgi:hypothetical protein